MSVCDGRPVETAESVEDMENMAVVGRVRKSEIHHCQYI